LSRIMHVPNMGPSHTLRLFLLGISICSTIAVKTDAFERFTCRDVITDLIKDNKTIEPEYIWPGPIDGLNDNVPRANIIALSYKGMSIPNFRRQPNCLGSNHNLQAVSSTAEQKPS
jgi:hypothetical protein